MENSGLTASDVALLNGRNYDDGWGNNGFMWIFALMVLAMNGNGFGFGGRNIPASTEEVQSGFNFAALERQNNEIVDTVRQGVYDTTGAVKDASYNNLSELRYIQNNISGGIAEMMRGFCSVERGIDGINYNAALNTAGINAHTTAQIQRVIDKFCEKELDDIKRENDRLQLQLAMSGVVRYPQQITYNAGSSPYCNCNNHCCGY